MLKLTSHCFLLLLIVLCACVGCGQADPLESRLKEVGYNPERIADELIARIKSTEKVDQMPKEGSSGGRKQEVSDADGRGDGPGGGRDPFTFEAIMEDINTKIDQLQEKSGLDVDVRSEVSSRVDDSDLSDELKAKVKESL